MKKTYTKTQIVEAIAYWKNELNKQLAESLSDNDMLHEQVIAQTEQGLSDLKNRIDKSIGNDSDQSRQMMSIITAFDKLVESLQPYVIPANDDSPRQ